MPISQSHGFEMERKERKTADEISVLLMSRFINGHQAALFNIKQFHTQNTPREFIGLLTLLWKENERNEKKKSSTKQSL